jgi:transcriptional regulator with XRE-family HTH domain
MTTLASLGTQIRQARKALGHSAADLGASAGLHRNTVQALETGKANVELATLLALCDQLDLDLALVPRRIAATAAADNALEPTALQRRLAALTPATTVPASTRGKGARR